MFFDHPIKFPVRIELLVGAMQLPKSIITMTKKIFMIKQQYIAGIFDIATPHVCQATAFTSVYFNTVVRILSFIFVLILTLPSWALAGQYVALSELVFYPSRSVPAEVLAKHDSKLSVEVEGIITSFAVNVGQHVKKGDILVSLDNSNFQYMANQVKAKIRGLTAKQSLSLYKLDRADKLAKSRDLSEDALYQRRIELDIVSSELQALEAELDLVNLSLKKTVLRAPFDGVIIDRVAQLGELVIPGNPVVRLVSMSRQEVQANLTLQQSLRIGEAQGVKLEVDQFNYDIELSIILPVFDLSQRMKLARFLFVNEPAQVGVLGRVVWADPAPYLPASYVVKHDNQLGLIILDENIEVFVELPDAQEGRDVLIDTKQFPLDTKISKIGYN